MREKGKEKEKLVHFYKITKIQFVSATNGFIVSIYSVLSFLILFKISLKDHEHIKKGNSSALTHAQVEIDSKLNESKKKREKKMKFLHRTTS